MGRRHTIYEQATLDVFRAMATLDMREARDALYEQRLLAGSKHHPPLPRPVRFRTGSINVSATVREYVREHPGCTIHDVRAGTGQNAQTVGLALIRANKAGTVRRESTGMGGRHPRFRYYPNDDVETTT